MVVLKSDFLHPAQALCLAKRCPGIVPGKNFFTSHSLRGEVVGAVLTHTNAMAPSANIKNSHAVVKGKRKILRAQRKKRPHFSSGQGYAANRYFCYSACVGTFDLLNPGLTP